MDNVELIDSFLEFKELKNIDKQTMQNILEDVFRTLFKRKFIHILMGKVAKLWV